MYKHWVSTRHFCKAVGKKRLDMQPAYTCPAFLSMHRLCRNAKYVPPTVLCPAWILTVAFRAGRYDSASRHCKNCPGFQQIRVESGIEVIPVELTRGEYWAVQEFRKNARHDQETYSEPILNAGFKVLMMMATAKTGSDSTEISDSESSDEDAEVLTPDEVLGWFT